MEGLYISKPFLFIIPLMMVIILYLLLQVSRLGSDTCTVIIPRYVEIPMVISEPSEAPHALPLEMPSTIAFTSTILSKVLNTTTLAVTSPEILNSTTSAPEILQILDQAAEILNNGTSLETNPVTQTVSLASNVSSFANSTLNSNSSSEEDEEESLTTATPLRVNQSSAGMSGDGSQYTLEERGSLYTLDYRIYFKGPQGYISPFHDIPLFADEANKVYNMIVEIPRWTNAKMEIATKDPLNPIKQDEKKGVARFVHNIFPHKGYIWNYGALPQTWEDPNHIVPDTGAKGDNDPIDVIEIGSKVRHRGAVVPVKLIGTLALLDEGETDWKLVTIAVDDPLAAQINNTADVETHFPGLLKASFEWFKHYKIPAGKPVNEFGYNGEYQEADFAHKVIADTHNYWKALMKETSPKLNTQSLQPDAVHQATQESWAAEVNRQPAHGDAATIPSEVDKWHFIQF